MNTLTDIEFDAATDVASISLRLHPLDVGFNLRAENMAIRLPEDTSATLRASYADRKGNRRVAEGPRDKVIDHLRNNGYRIVS